MDVTQSLVLSAALTAVTAVMGLSALVLRLRLQGRTQRHRLLELEEQLCRYRDKFAQFAGEQEEQRCFVSALNQADISNRLQQPYLQGKDQCTPPERYRYVSRMVASGMGADEIAGVLAMSVAEARQLVALMAISPDAQEKTLT